MFAHLDDAARAALGQQLRWLCLPGGRPLFKAGDGYLLESACD